jgi:UDP-4-amino-4-deoxy-L-arabinose-oxoglutarate aminotransferase
MKIEFYKHNLGKEESQKILECLDGIFLTTGSYVSAFENNFARYLNLKYSIGLTSCTAALHLSLLALGIGKNDEVITTPMTFIATATAIMHTGAKPVFVDVEKDTGLIDADKIKNAITKRTKAIIPVHLYGQMCDMNKIKKIAVKYNLKIVEDAAHCIEGERDGIRPGQIGDVACFSFYATKSITSGEGGAIATNNQVLADRVRMLRQHGMSKEAADRYSGHYKHWDMTECGWKYNMDNIQASLLLPQLEKIDKNLNRRAQLYNEYLEQLKNVPGINYPKIAKNSKSAYHLLTIWVNKDKRDYMLQKLSEKGIGVAVNYRAIHLLTYFKKQFGFKRGDFPAAEDIGDRTISLPFWIELKSTDIQDITAAINQIISST